MNLDESFHVVLKHLLEEVLQLVTSEELQDFLPFWGRFEPSEIWLHVSGKNPECCGLSNSVGSYQSEYLSTSWGWESVQFETVSSIPVSDLVLQPFRQIDDLNGRKGASFNAHTASNTECFRDEADLRCFCHLNANFTCFVHRARLSALLSAFFWLALIWVNDSYS